MCLGQNREAKRLGKEIDALMLSIIVGRKKATAKGVEQQPNLLGLLLDKNHVDERKGRTLSTRELVDECKTFFFGGHETTALSWPSPGAYCSWQCTPCGNMSSEKKSIRSLEMMGWVMNEVLRLYPTAPNVLRQARGDIQVDQDSVIPDGTNMWIDVVAMHHDQEFWGDDVNEFKPERFKDDLHGGCYHRMGYLPFGFGGRMCVGRNLSMMEYKIMLTLILTRFSFSLSPNTLLSFALYYAFP